MSVMLRKCAIKCNNQINENKEFEANLNLLKRDKPNDCGHMLLLLCNIKT